MLRLSLFLVGPPRVALDGEEIQVGRRKAMARGQVVFVTGGPGRGKTALMHEFARRAMEAHPDLLVAGGQVSELDNWGWPCWIFPMPGWDAWPQSAMWPQVATWYATGGSDGIEPSGPAKAVVGIFQRDLVEPDVNRRRRLVW